MGSHSSKNSTKNSAKEESVVCKRVREAPYVWPEDFNAISKFDRPNFFNDGQESALRSELTKIRQRKEEEKNKNGESSSVFNKLAEQESILKEHLHLGTRPNELERAFKLGIKQANFFHLDVQTRKY